MNDAHRHVDLRVTWTSKDLQINTANGTSAMPWVLSLLFAYSNAKKLVCGLRRNGKRRPQNSLRLVQTPLPHSGLAPLASRSLLTLQESKPPHPHHNHFRQGLEGWMMLISLSLCI